MWNFNITNLAHFLFPFFLNEFLVILYEVVTVKFEPLGKLLDLGIQHVQFVQLVVFDHWETDNGTLDSIPTNSENSISISGPTTITAVFKVVTTPVPPPAPVSNLKGIQFPTAFSPNTDGKNEVFKLHVGGDVRSFTFRVYDRWGNQIVSTDEPNFTWDGTYKGKALPSGVYVYQLETEFKNGDFKSTSGNITIVQ